MIIKRRQLLLATLIVALGAAVFVNWYYTKPSIETSGNTAATNSVSDEEKQGANLGDARYVISSDVTLDDGAAQAQASEYFASAKLRRKTAHDEAAEALNDIIKDGSSNSEAIKQATAALKELSDCITLESDIENLITAKIGCENLCILNNGKAEIIIENGSLDDVTVVKIKEIAVKHTEYPVDNITIIEMEY